jgi:hypothetical protein
LSAAWAAFPGKSYCRTALALFLFSFTRVVGSATKFMGCVKPLEDYPAYVASAPAITCGTPK